MLEVRADIITHITREVSPKLLARVPLINNRKATYVNGNRNNFSNIMGFGLFRSEYRRRIDPHTTGNRPRCVYLQHADGQTICLANQQLKRQDNT